MKRIKLIEPSQKYHDNSKELILPSDEIFTFYKQSNVFLMPSIIESFGIVTIEAMAFGLPIIINNSPGNRDIVRNGKDGFLFSNSEKQLSDIMEKFINNKELLEKQSQKSIKRSRNFNWSEVVDKYINIYLADKESNFT